MYTVAFSRLKNHLPPCLDVRENTGKPDEENLISGIEEGRLDKSLDEACLIG